MLKDIIRQKGLSVYRVSKLSGIPYTTINEIVLGKKKAKDCSIKTILAIARALNVPVQALLDNQVVGVNTNWQEAKKKKYRFPVIHETNLFDISRIHPLKQKDVTNLAQALKERNEISKVIVFGGSTTIRCTRTSDIDVAIELKEEFNTNEVKNDISQVIQSITNFNADVLWLNNLDSETNIYQNILRGVTIYE